MLQYADSTIADYNSFYSADCTDATLRPSMTISYTPGNSSYSVNEGETLALPITRAAGVVTWVSSDSTIATVNSNGVVTGIKAGEVTITAFSNGTEYQSFTVYVTVANGVYRIRNSNGFYLGTYGGIAENTSVKLLGNASSGFYQVCQLWKVTYLSDGYYSIRPLHKLDMGLHANGNVDSSVDITSVGTSDTISGVTPLNRWGISRNSSGDAYNLNHVNTISLGLRAEGYTPSAGMNVTIASNSSDLSYFNWFLDKVDDPPSGVLLFDDEADCYSYSIVRKVMTNVTYSLSDLNLATYVFSPNGSDFDITWESLDPQIVSVNSTTGAIAGLVPGQSATVRCSIQTESEYCSATYSVVVYDNIETIFYAIPDTGHDHSSSLQNAKSELATINFTQTTIKATSVNALTCKADMASARIFTNRSHGVALPPESDTVMCTSIILVNSIDPANRAVLFSNPMLNMNEISAAIEDTDDFSNLDIALFVGCETGAGGVGGNNLPTRVVERGCRVAIGFTQEINCAAANAWVETFYQCFADGDSVEEAANFATIDVGTSVNGISRDTVVIVGDSSLTYCDLLP